MSRKKERQREKGGTATKAGATFHREHRDETLPCEGSERKTIYQDSAPTVEGNAGAGSSLLQGETNEIGQTKTKNRLNKRKEEPRLRYRFRSSWERRGRLRREPQGVLFGNICSGE